LLLAWLGLDDWRLNLEWNFESFRRNIYLNL
jgi:hypothetical protein